MTFSEGLTIKIAYFFIVFGSVSLAKADGQVEAVCTSLGNPAVIHRNQELSLNQAWQKFRSQLEPRYKNLIHSLPEIASSKELSLHTRLQIYSDYEKTLYATISADSLNPISSESIEKRSAEIIQLLIAAIQAENSFTNVQKMEIDEKLSTAKVLTLEALNREPESVLKIAEIASYFSFCGDDLAALDASATLVQDGQGKWQSDLIICPKIATLSVPLQNKAMGIDFILAHEFSHLITRSLLPSNQQPLGLDEKLLAAQDDYLNCLQSQDGQRLRSLSQILEHSPLNESDIQTLGDAYRLKTQFEKYNHKDPTSIQSHESELLADRWADRVISPLANEKNVENYLALFCENLDNEDEGVHPTNRFRLENFLDRSCDQR